MYLFMACILAHFIAKPLNLWSSTSARWKSFVVLPVQNLKRAKTVQNTKSKPFMAWHSVTQKSRDPRTVTQKVSWCFLSEVSVVVAASARHHRWNRQTKRLVGRC